MLMVLLLMMLMMMGLESILVLYICTRELVWHTSVGRQTNHTLTNVYLHLGEVSRVPFTHNVNLSVRDGDDDDNDGGAHSHRGGRLCT